MAKSNVDVLDMEIVNPIIEIIKKYDNFEKEENARYEEYEKIRKSEKSKLENHTYKLGKVLVIYAVLFIGVSAFKMHALYEIVDLKMELKSLNSKIFESESLINSLKYSDKPYINITDIEKESKKLGFTEEKNIEYIHFNDNR